LSGVAAYAGGTTSLSSPGAEPERAPVSRVTDGFFRLLGVPAVIGRTFTPDEEVAGAPRVAVISHGTWQRRYGGDPGIVGRSIMMDAVPVTVVGVMPASFRYPPVGGSRDGSAAIWVPMRLRYDSLWTRNNHYLSMIARLKPGATRDGVDAELRGMTARWSTTYTETYAPDQPVSASVRTLHESILGSTRPYLLSLLGAVAFVLLIACVNVANLQLVRAEARRKDAAIRSALGASRLRLARQGITENLLYAVVGGTLGLVVAWWGVRALVLLAPADVPRMTDVGLDATVLVFSAAVTLLTGLALGVVPALADRERDTSETLKEGGKTSSAAARTAGRARRRLVTAEIALAVIMLSGAALMVRSLARMQAIDLGFSPEGVATMTITPPASPQGTSQPDADARLVALYQEVLRRVRALPGVTAAAAAAHVPMADGYDGWSILLDGAPATTVAQAPVATPDMVTPGYFQTLGIGRVRGRLIEETDGRDAAPVVVINEAMARRYWPGKDPVGHTLRMYSEGSPWVTIVGVVRDVKAWGFTEDAPPTMYFPHAQSGRTAYYTPRPMNILVRTAGTTSAILPSLRRIARELEPLAPVSRETTVEMLVDASVGARRFATTLIVTFAGLALLLAGIGIYGVISTSVAQRSYEIGVRMALGARRTDVMAMIMREGLRTAFIGASLGLAGALSSTFLLRSIIYDVKAWDPLSLGAAVMSLLAVVVVACSVPAARATAVDPNRALRAE
jgi:predicted permease